MKNSIKPLRKWLGRKLLGLGRRLEGPSVSHPIPLEISIAASAFVREERISWQEKCSLKIGANTHISGDIVFEKEGAHVQVGERVFCSGRLISAGNIVVGDDVMIAWGTTVIDHDAHSIYFNLRQHDVVDWMAGKKNWADVAVRDVVIENKAWIGFNVIILKGVRIGEGAVVGAGAVVRKNVEPWTVVAGNPATFVKKIHKRG